MADTYVIDTVFKAQDQMTSTVTRLTDRMGLFGKRSENSFKRATLGATRFKTVLGGVLGANLITSGVNQLRQGLFGVTREFLDFDHAITSASAKFGIERNTKEFKKLGDTAREVAKINPFTAGEMGKGLDFLAMAGFGYEQAMAALPGVTQLAIATQTDFAEASDIASDALSSLGLATEETLKNPAKLASNLERVNDVFAKTTTTSNTNLQMLFEGMKMVAPVAVNLGSNVEELSAMMGVLANSGIKATMSGTALRNMYLRLTSGVAEVRKELKKYKIDIVHTQGPQKGQMRSMIDILDDVKHSTRKLNDEKRQQVLTHLFGNRAIASATVLMEKGKKKLWEYTRSLEASKGAAAKMAEAMGKSWQNRIAALKSRLVELGLKVFDTFEKEIPEAFKKVERWLEQFDGDDFKRWIIDTKNELKPLIAGLIDVVKEGGKLVSFAQESGVTVGGITKAFIAWKVAILGLNTALVTTKSSLFGLLATKGLVPLLKTLGFAGTATLGAAIGVGAGGAYLIGSDLVKKQDEAHARLTEMKRLERMKKVSSIKEKSFAGIKDKTLRELSKQRYEETGVVPEAMQKTFSQMGRMPSFSSVDTPEKSVIEVNIKSPVDVDTKIKQGKNAPVVQTNKQRAPNINNNLGKN